MTHKPSTNSKELVEQLRRLRKESGHNQHTFAEMTGYCRTQIALYETGKRTPNLIVATDFAEALGYELVLKLKD